MRVVSWFVCWLVDVSRMWRRVPCRRTFLCVSLSVWLCELTSVSVQENLPNSADKDERREASRGSRHNFWCEQLVRERHALIWYEAGVCGTRGVEGWWQARTYRYESLTLLWVTRCQTLYAQKTASGPPCMPLPHREGNGQKVTTLSSGSQRGHSLRLASLIQWLLARRAQRAARRRLVAAWRPS